MEPSRQRVHYVAGASGTGTSTRAVQLQRELAGGVGGAPCLVIATDVVRAQLRAVLDDADHPDLWGESFNLPHAHGDRIRDGVGIDAFLRQCAPILRAVEAGVAYALTEGWHVVVEGVHLVPGQFAVPGDRVVEVVAELLVVRDRVEHAARFRGREIVSRGRRPAEHYERNLARIHVVQAELLDRWEAWRAELGDAAGIRLVGP